jgi:DNA ligase-1
LKPLLATDYDEDKIVFPIGVQPKIDGVRGLTTEGYLTGRSLKKHKNKYTTALYSQTMYANLDGELAAGSETHPDLCRMTSSALSTIQGEPFTFWHVFDTLDKHVVAARYIDRYEWLKSFLDYQHRQGLCEHARLVPMHIASDLQQLRAFHDAHMEAGYEGTILRGLNALHKQGRSTVLQGQLLRIKDFITAEFLITGITEGNENQNEAQTNELGHTFRTSHQENKVLNGMLGSFQGKMISDVRDPQTNKILLTEGQEVTVSPGEISHDLRRMYFQTPSLVIGQIGKFKFFPKGHKEKPRFPVFQCFRSVEDIS